MKISTTTTDHVTTSAASPAEFMDQLTEREASVTFDSPGDRKVWINLEEPGLAPISISIKRDALGNVRLFFTSHDPETYLSADWISEDGESFLVPPSASLVLTRRAS